MSQKTLPKKRSSSPKYVAKQFSLPDGLEYDQAEILGFNKAFGQNVKLEIEPKNNKGVIKLCSLNMKEFEEKITAISCPELRQKIRDTVESVHSYGYSNGMRQYVGYNAERKVRNRKLKSLSRLEDSPGQTSKAVNNPLPKKYTDVLQCMDSEEALKKLPDNCIDLIFTSPPYNFGLDYSNAGADSDKWDVYFAKLFKVLDECSRVLKHGGRLAINIQPLFSDYIPTHHIISNHLKKELLWKGEILWEKNNYNCKYTAWGSWKSPSSPYLKYTWEFIEVFCKGQLKKDGNRDDADILADDFKKWVYAKWSIAPERNMKKLGHPAMFPEELAKRVIQLFSFKNDAVLDPFMGVGTTCKVAKLLGRRYLGIDVSKEYVTKARQRIGGIL